MKFIINILLLLTVSSTLSAQTEVFSDPKAPENNIHPSTIEMNPNWLKCVEDIDCTLVYSSCHKCLPVGKESITDYDQYLAKAPEDCSKVLKDITKPEAKCVDQICRADGTLEAPTQEMLN